MLSPSHKICLMCLRKLYVMQNKSSSALHLSDSIYLKIALKTQVGQIRSKDRVADHEDHDQLTTDAEGSIELPDEGCDLNTTTRCTDEDGSGSGVAEASKDVKIEVKAAPAM